ncbi:hypothetical protein HNQ41_001795 [Texcoconibacillus texcoconensis]|uniref:YdbS-like PH domain-containing protein n=1 Tax=Texcoconibacillus texcoconensis TaxID=1095777 RepID=A0A840QQA6_9BACI|nr:PH domain-containing protein [Texcoconibacillus texcoconensis]MBB5173606.1 hypothetical protein [Texcoconibacillus texcoconensis]
MRPFPQRSLSEKALPVWRIVSSLEAIIVLLILIALAWFSTTTQWEIPTWIYVAVAFVYFVGFIVYVVIWPKLQWKKWRYEVLQHETELMFGVIIVRRILIPMARVQHVDTKQGPILRRYGLASVTISTAATVHEIPALTHEKADELRDYISQLAREADQNE